jgi:hypothetical protein
MRIGVIGQAGKATRELHAAIDLLLGDPEVKQVIYLGMDGALDAVVADWSTHAPREDDFLARAAQLARAGTADELDELLRDDRSVQRWSAVRRLPEPPARAIEMLDKWIVLAVHDKAILDEDDVANAHLIVYGKANDADFKRFGPRAFLTPGPLAKGKVARLTLRSDGLLDVDLLDLEGRSLLHEEVAPSAAKMVVTS